MRWEAYELHCVSKGHNKFYRIMLLGTTVLVRWGSRGGNGQLKVHNFSTLGEAGEFAADQRDAKLSYKKGYYEVYSTEGETGLAQMPPDSSVLDDLFMLRWKNSIAARLSREQSKLTLFSGLLGEVKVNPSARFVLEEINTTQHVVDVANDRILAKAYYRFHTEPNTFTTHNMGSGLASDSIEMLEIAIGLYNSEVERPSELIEVARRLVNSRT
jgi:predicted DNA-binding WGR domain protein